tara:strand:- start:524 stop:2302 length:1779 start_codon:yes stop_codon:yes gene_type:complete
MALLTWVLCNLLFNMSLKDFVPHEAKLVMLVHTTAGAAVCFALVNERTPVWRVEGMLYYFGTILTYKLIMMVDVSLAHVIKATEPVFAVALLVCVGERPFHAKDALVCVALMFGMIAITTDSSLGSREGNRSVPLIIGLLSNTILQGQKILSKRSMQSVSPVDELHGLWRDSALMLLIEVVNDESVFTVLGDMALAKWMQLFISGTSFIGYQLSSYVVLKRLGAFYHSILNVLKRVVLCCVGIWYVGDQVHPSKLLAGVLVMCVSFVAAKDFPYDRAVMSVLAIASVLLDTLHGHPPPHHKSNACLTLYKFIPYTNNFGDQLGVDVAIAASRCRSMDHGIRLYGLGSTLHHAPKGNAVIWGTGAMQYGLKETSASQLTVRAVRGPLTLHVLGEGAKSALRLDPSTPQGDPGLLAPMLMPTVFRRCKPNHAVCVIPHHNDEAYFANHSFQRISVESHYKKVIHEIAQCALVASSSLHGIIVAEAFGVPARWLQPDDSPSHSSESTNKFCDYFAGSRRSGLKAARECVSDRGPFARAVSLEDAVKKDGLPGLDYNASGLLNAFPHESVEECATDPKCVLALDATQQLGKQRRCI